MGPVRWWPPRIASTPLMMRDRRQVVASTSADDYQQAVSRALLRSRPGSSQIGAGRTAAAKSYSWAAHMRRSTPADRWLETQAGAPIDTVAAKHRACRERLCRRCLALAAKARACRRSAWRCWRC